MSFATKIKLTIVTVVLVLLAGKLLGDSVKLWNIGNEKGVVNLPACAKQSSNSVSQANASYSFGFRMTQIQNGIRLVPPRCMGGVVVATSMSGLVINTTPIGDDFVIDGATLIMLRDNDVESFGVRLIDTEGDFIDVKIVLTPGMDTFEVLVR